MTAAYRRFGCKMAALSTFWPLLSRHGHDVLPQWRFRIRGQLNVLMVSIPEID
jgi:hypothetical protein